jgi:adenosine deaminase
MIISLTHKLLVKEFVEIVSETNGISLVDTLDLMLSSSLKAKNQDAYLWLSEYRELLNQFMVNKIDIQQLRKHQFNLVLEEFFRRFPLKYQEEHIHLSGSLTAEFIYSKLLPLITGPHKDIYEKKIKNVYGENSWPIKSIGDVDKLIRLKEDEGFTTYLRILYLASLIFISKQAHADAAYHMASELYKKQNVGSIRLKFMMNRASSQSDEKIPGLDQVTSEDVVLGLYDGFKKFQNENPDFKFTLSPSFRKEPSYFDEGKFASRKEHFMHQIDEILALTEKYPALAEHLHEVDTVGDEREMYRKEHFFELQHGFRKLQYRGFKIKSHHGETWHTLKKGIQAVDNAMNIWHIDSLEHGISLGINPNLYFHQLYQRIILNNLSGHAVESNSIDYKELMDLAWGTYRPVLQKLLSGEVLTENDRTQFLKAKFHTAREIEQYQHDVLNRLIQKGVSLITLPSSNNKLTGKFRDYKDHPFSWWEKKNVNLGVGTDNYITLNTNFIQEMLILLLTDATNLKITKLLMVTTGETRRPFISQLLWKMRKDVNANVELN